MVGFRTIALAAMLAGLSWFSFFNQAPAHVLVQSVADRFDERPGRAILFVGNSRMFDNDMPYMVRKIADSANAPEKYQVTMWALPGETLENHWKRGEVRRLLAGQRWDAFVLQAESAAHVSGDSRRNFHFYGDHLVAQAGASAAATSLIVGWVYGASQFQDEAARTAAYSTIQQDHFALARRTGAGLINAGAAWHDAEERQPPFRLDTDGNHPSLHGSYLTALMVYAHISGGDVGGVTYVPRGMSAEDATLIRRAVTGSIRSQMTAPPLRSRSTPPASRARNRA